MVRLFQSRTLLYAGASCVLGLSLARLGHSVVLATVFSKLPPVHTAVNNKPISDSVISYADPGITLGGVLFQAMVGRETTQPVAEAAAVKPFKLTATLEGEQDVARALIEVQGESIREYCALGSGCQKADCVCRVQGAAILSIAKEHIWIKMGDTRAMLRIGQSTVDIQNNQVSPATAAKAQVAGAEVINQNISREEVLRILQGKEGKIFEAQFGPHVVEGKIVGYKISRVSDDHVFAKLGAKSGDVIRKVNGYPLDDMERLMDLYKALRTMSAVKIELERGGKNLIYNFHVRN